MYCRNCGHEVQNVNSSCNYCGKLPLNGKNYCQECGFPTTENQSICSSCQEQLKYAQISDKPSFEQPLYYQGPNQKQYDSKNNDVPNTFANLLSCCSIPFTLGLPIIGLVFYLIWKDDKPKTANSVCMWSLIPFIIYIFLFIIGFFTRLTRYFS